MTGFIVHKPESVSGRSRGSAIIAIAPKHIASDLDELFPAFPHALVFLHHDEVVQPEALLELTRTEIRSIERSASRCHQVMTLARLVATRRAVRAFARRHRDTALMPTQVSVAYVDNGKPELRCKDVALEPLFSGTGLALVNGPNFSVALVGTGPVGLGWHRIEHRSTEAWHRLLGDKALELARTAATHAEEPFDCAATRVQTLLDAGKTISPLDGAIPSLGERLGASYLSFAATLDGQSYKWISMVMRPLDGGEDMAILTVLFKTN